LFTSAESIQKLQNILAWKPAEVPPFDLGQIANENRKWQKAIGAVVADALLPVLNREDLSPSCINAIFEFERTAFSIVQAFPGLLRLVPQSEERAVTDILTAMVSREADQTAAGFNAIYRWMRLHSEGGLNQIPKRLLDSVVSIVETRREPGLLHALNLSSHLLCAGALDRDAQERIIAVLGLIFIEASYGSARDNPTLDLTTITLVRAAAVRLAVALLSQGNTSVEIQKWIEDAAEDPMPEVRFAATTPPE
jgi:hypothetical protein